VVASPTPELHAAREVRAAPSQPGLCSTEGEYEYSFD
jgi:hypothetical protein